MQTVLVGCGRMGGALLQGWRRAALPSVFFVDPNLAEAPGAAKLGGYDDVASLGGPLCVVLAVKPAVVTSAVRALAPYLTTDSLVVSVAAGVTLAQLRHAAGGEADLVRTMPNTPAAIGRGAVGAVSDRPLSAERHAFAQSLLQAAGEVFWLEGEALIDAVTAISGSGPAYYYRFTEMMAQAGVRLGLPFATAQRLAALTFTGSAALLEATGKTPEQLRSEVTSPNGVTAAALSVFDQDDRLGAMVEEVARVAVSRSREMSGEQ